MAGLWSLCSLSSAVWQAVKPPEGDVQISRKYPLPVFQGAADRSYKDAVFTVNGTMKLISGERMQLSFLMPIIRTEVARMEVTPGRNIAGRDRMGKRYVRATRKELKDMLPKKADFAHLEKILFNASKPNGKKELSGKELGIPSLEKGRIELSGFSNNSFSLTPTELSSKYTQVELNEILEMLMSL